MSAARFHGASYADATIGDWHRAGATERGGDPFPALDYDFYPGSKTSAVQSMSDTGKGKPAVESTPSKAFAGGVPIREAMMSILNIADQLRASDTMTPEQRNTLMSALADFDGAKSACVGNGAWQELRFINGVSSAVSTFVGRRGLAGAGNENSELGTESGTDRGVAVSAPGDLSGQSGTLQSGFLPDADAPTEFSPSARRELADNGRTSESGSRVDDLAGMVSYRPAFDSAEAGWTSTTSASGDAHLDSPLDGALSTGNRKQISMVSKGRAEDSANLGMTS